MRSNMHYHPTTKLDRHTFIGGSDARIIMGEDEAALLRLWREKRGEAEPEDLSRNLIVQLGSATEDLNRRWYELKTGQAIKDVQRHIRHHVLAKAQTELVNPPKSLTAVLERDRTERGGQAYRYAPLSAGLDIIRRTLGKHELAVLQRTHVDRESATCCSPPRLPMAQGNGRGDLAGV